MATVEQKPNGHKKSVRAILGQASSAFHDVVPGYGEQTFGVKPGAKQLAEPQDGLPEWLTKSNSDALKELTQMTPHVEKPYEKTPGYKLLDALFAHGEEINIPARLIMVQKYGADADRILSKADKRIYGHNGHNIKRNTMDFGDAVFASLDNPYALGKLLTRVIIENSLPSEHWFEYSQAEISEPIAIELGYRILAGKRAYEPGIDIHAWPIDIYAPEVRSSALHLIDQTIQVLDATIQTPGMVTHSSALHKLQRLHDVAENTIDITGHVSNKIVGTSRRDNDLHGLIR